MEHINKAMQLLQHAADEVYNLQKICGCSSCLDDLHLLARVQLRLYQSLVREFEKEFGA